MITYVQGMAANDPLLNRNYLNYWDSKSYLSENSISRKIERTIANRAKSFSSEFIVLFLRLFFLFNYFVYLFCLFVYFYLKFYSFIV